MIQDIVYEATETCPHCSSSVIVRVRSDDPDILSKAPGLKEQAKDEAMNSHWYRFHHICAKCGELIKTKSGETSFALLSRIEWPINEEYARLNEAKQYSAINVHRSCVTPDEQGYGRGPDQNA